MKSINFDRIDRFQFFVVDHALLNKELKKAKKNRAGFEAEYLRVMIRDALHSTTPDTNLHIITSSNYNDTFFFQKNKKGTFFMIHNEKFNDSNKVPRHFQMISIDIGDENHQV